MANPANMLVHQTKQNKTKQKTQKREKKIPLPFLSTSDKTILTASAIPYKSSQWHSLVSCDPRGVCLVSQEWGRARGVQPPAGPTSRCSPLGGDRRPPAGRSHGRQRLRGAGNSLSHGPTVSRLAGENEDQLSTCIICRWFQVWKLMVWSEVLLIKVVQLIQLLLFAQ